MTNGDQGGAVMAELGRRIQRAYEWDSMAEPAPRGYDPPLTFEAIELPAHVLEAYVGEYRLNERTTGVVTIENGVLHSAPAGQPLTPLLAAGMDHFFRRNPPVEVFFVRDADGNVSGLTVVQRGQRQHWMKIR